MHNRREFLAAVPVGLLAASAGCLKLATNDRAEYTASEATVSEGGLQGTGYQHTDTQEETIEETVEAAGVSRTVVATNWISIYEKSLSIPGFQQEAARFAVVSTPAVKILSRTFNPIDEMSHQELLDRFREQLGGQYEGLDGIEYVESRDEVILGEEVEVSTFETTASVEGEDVELYVHVTTVTHEGDLIVGVGAHPTALSQERTNVYELMRSIEHDGDN